MSSDAFGCNRMQSDASRCVGTRSGTSGNFQIFWIFTDDFGDFLAVFGSWGLTFIDVLRVGGLLLLGLTIGRSHYCIPV